MDRASSRPVGLENKVGCVEPAGRWAPRPSSSVPRPVLVDGLLRRLRSQGIGQAASAECVPGLPRVTTVCRSRATHLRWVPRREDAVVSVSVDSGRWNEPGETLEELEGGEDDLRPAVGRRAREAVEESGVG